MSLAFNSAGARGLRHADNVREYSDIDKYT
jgi:hypothetical protein